MAARVFLQPAGLLIAGLLISVIAWAQQGEWRLDKDEDGIRIHSRAVEGWEIREFRGQARIDARLPSVVAALDDPQVSVELVDVVEESTVHDRESATRYRVYSKMDMPFPLSDRDIFNQREISQDPDTLVVTITDEAIAGVMPKKKGLVRIEKSYQRWILAPNADGSVQAEVYTLSDPAGPIPTSMINAMSVDTPFKMITRLRKIVKREKYANAKPGFIRDEADKPGAKAAAAGSKAAPVPARAAASSTPEEASGEEESSDTKEPCDDPARKAGSQ